MKQRNFVTKLKKFLLKSLLFLIILIVIVLMISFTLFRVDTLNFSALDKAPEQILVPDYFSDIWFKGQGYPIKYQNLKEGWSDLPSGGKIYILPNVLTKLPYKNLEESEDWVNFVNTNYKPNPAWTFDPRRRKGNYRCMAQAASTISDWHALLLGNDLPSYKSIYTGQMESGLNPKVLESIYYQRAESDSNYHLNKRKLMEDPVSHTPVPYSLTGYVDILSLATKIVRSEKLKVSDYNLPLSYEYTPGDFHIYSKPKVVFRNKAFWEIVFKKEPKMTQEVVEAIHKHGILYGGIKARLSMLNSNLKKTKLGFIPLNFFSGHGVSIVGYIQKDNHTYLVYRETFGLGNEETPDFGVAYRIFPVYGFNEIYAFPQPLNIKAEKVKENEFVLTVRKDTNGGFVRIKAMPDRRQKTEDKRQITGNGNQKSENPSDFRTLLSDP